MNSETKLLLALMQIENVSELLKDGPFAGFFSSHLLAVRFEIERQLANLTQHNKYTTMKE
jgi:hypothetical protein